MKLLVAGGALQGLEALYLAREAGYETVLVDRNPQAPAQFLAGEFIPYELGREAPRQARFLGRFDLVLPALENDAALGWLERAARIYDVPLAFDPAAFAVTASKRRSNRIFRTLRLPGPKPWPGCGLPVVAKPVRASGSRGVRRFEQAADLGAWMSAAGRLEEWIIEEFLDGPSFSLEVLADRGHALPLQITRLGFDPGFDCKRVLAGPGIGTEVSESFGKLARVISEHLGLRGIMDIEVIQSRGGLNILEIDARLPSQTPSAVYHSSGLNMVEALAEYWLRGRLPEPPPPRRAALYEHLRLHQGVLEVAGEHVMARASGLRICRDLFEADVLLTNLETWPRNWVATVIHVAEDESAAWNKRRRTLSALQETFGVRCILDRSPFQGGDLRDPFETP